MHRILIGPSSFGDAGAAPLRLMEERGLLPVRHPFKRPLTADEVLAYGADCVGILAGSEPLDAAVLERLPALRCISRCGVGMDNVDQAAAAARGVAVYNTPEALTRAVAELALGLLLAVLRRIPLGDRAMRAGEWRKDTGSLLLGKRVGIVGLGRIGRAFAGMLSALGCDVVGYDPAADTAAAAAAGVRLVPLPQLLSECDVVSLHVPLSDDTRHLIGAAELAQMRADAVLMNTGRGGTVDEDALLDALRAGRIGGAALDVFESEPYRGPLIGLDNVVLSAHAGSRAREAKLIMEMQAVENLLAGLGLLAGAQAVST